MADVFTRRTAAGKSYASNLDRVTLCYVRFGMLDLARFRIMGFVLTSCTMSPHLSLQKDTPESRPLQAPEAGRIVAIPVVGGLHHRYERRAAELSQSNQLLTVD